MMDVLRQFPAIWAIVGSVVTGAIFWLTSGKVLNLQGRAAEKLSNTLDRQIVALEKERDHYRENLHGERNSRQSAELRVKELEQRPDLSSITTLLSDQKDWMKSLGKSLDEHSESDAKIFGKIEVSLSRFPIELERMSLAFDERQAAVLEHFRNGKS